MGSLVFFAFVIGLDLLFKSMKDKKKIEAIREKKMQELKNKPADNAFKPVETRVKREVQKNPSLARKQEENTFHGEGHSYRDEHEGYRERYDERYETITNSYDTKTKESDEREALYDKHAIETRSKKEYEDLDIRNYGRERKEKKIDIPVPTASTFKEDVLNGIIFSEILGKPKSLQKR